MGMEKAMSIKVKTQKRVDMKATEGRMSIETSLGKDGIRDDKIRQEEVVGFLAKGSACACAIEVTILMQHFA